MKADAVVSRLDKVRATAHGEWVARCPAHEDRTPSLKVRELDDGRVLIHCYAGCSPDSVLGAIGMSFDDLYPEPLPKQFLTPLRRPFSPLAVLASTAQEALTLSVIAADLAGGAALTDELRERIVLASRRLEQAYALATT